MISVHELTKTFVNHQREIVAVDHLTFTRRPGEVYGLLGPNGAGKTTTVRMILGLLTPTSGYAEVDGLRSSEFPDEVKRRVGLVSTSAGLYQWLTSREMLLFFADLYGLDPERADERLRQLTRVDGPRPVSRPALLDVEHGAKAAGAVGPGPDSRSAHHAAG